jgi:hypothetical protein
MNHVPDDYGAPGQWERCLGCGLEYAYPYLCRTHMLCGACHNETPSAHPDGPPALAAPNRRHRPRWSQLLPPTPDK